MDSTIFKYKHHYKKQNQYHLNKKNNNNKNNINSSSSSSNNISSNNHNNQNPIFILNAETNNILPNNPPLYYSNVNDNDVESLSSTASSVSSTTTASSSVWSSASSTMCSPAAHALQKLFSCSSKNFKLNHHGNHNGIESNRFKSKSEIFKKKSKFWKYLEDEEANEKNYQQGIDKDAAVNANPGVKKVPPKSFKLIKSKYWTKSYESDNQNQQDLSELLEYSCSLCDDCQCVDCQIGYFNCENSDDNSSECSFHLSTYEEDEYADDLEKAKELETSKDTHNDNEQYLNRKLDVESQTPPTYNMSCCVCNDFSCSKSNCCQQCFIESIQADGEESLSHHQDFITSQDH